MKKPLELISKMASQAKSSGFRCDAAAAGAMRTRGTQSPEKAAEQKSADCSPNAFLRWVLDILRLGIREPFKNKNYTSLFLALFFVFFALFVFIPVWTVAGNTIAAQRDIFTARDYLLLASLSSLSSLFITMQVYVMRRKRKMSGVGAAGAGGLGTLFAGIAGTAFCASCLAPLFALFGIGLGGVVFVLNYRFYFVIGITLFMLTAIYLTARKIGKVCTSC